MQTLYRPIVPVQKNLSTSPAYADVVFSLPLAEPLTYEIPDSLRGRVEVGMRVLAPLGRRKITGYVVSLADRPGKDIPLKPLEEILTGGPVVSAELMDLTRWIADYYQASWGEAIRAALPAGLVEESREHFTLTESGAEALESGPLSKTACAVLETVREHPGLTLKQLERRLGETFRPHTLARLRAGGFVDGGLRLRRRSVDTTAAKIVRLLLPEKRPENIDALLRRSPKQKLIYDLLQSGAKNLKDLSRTVPASSAPLKALVRKGLVETVTVKSPRQAAPAAPPPARSGPLKFTRDQAGVYRELADALDLETFRTFLLQGVTGSGKTEIYLRCIQHTLERGKTAIMMVPEISLTPQTLSRFQTRFGDRVALLHSGLTQVERYLEWQKIRDGRAAIAVGARSAVFAPFDNPGLIVIDEEHDPSYKQDASPRYHARDTAIMRARASGAVVILGSATPSLESRRNAETGKYGALSLPRRVRGRLMPLIEIIDMRRERNERKNFSIFSGMLVNGIRHRLERGEQVFLFLNRRGTAHYIFCRDCGFVFHCPHCSVTLTFHASEKRLRCHYCNHMARVPDRCADCSGEVIRFSGFGTQKLEEEVQRLFPEARILRLDRDTTRGAGAFAAMYDKMVSGDIDILIGTQMITKGHDFPNVTLVGVVLADLSLNVPDFRSAERSFQLLTQVAGRAGRGGVPGQVIIQTHHPEHYVFEYVRGHDYEKFFSAEMRYRNRLNYPPNTRLAALVLESSRERSGEAAMRRLKRALTAIAGRRPGLELLGPSRAALYRIKNKYRWHLILRAREVRTLQSVLKRIRELPEWKQVRNFKLIIDVDPVNML